MSLVGIIANPASGKDIRRVVARGLTVPDHEKINIIRRVVVGIAALGVASIRWMPDSAGLVERAVEGLQLSVDARPLDQRMTDTPEDTTAAAAALRERGAGCIVVLGGDGTCRVAAKGAVDTPLLPISTGTNNAFPFFVEGTLAGLAAATVAQITQTDLVEQMVTRAPCLRVLREDEAIDMALIDIVSYSGMVGARAVWQMERVHQLISVRHAPGTIGLSAIAGYLGLKPPSSDSALALTLDSGNEATSRRVLAPVAPGVVQPVAVQQSEWLGPGEAIRIERTPCVLALDGERELPIRNGMVVDVQYDPAGPRVVDVQRALEIGVERGLFDPANGALSSRGSSFAGV